jgi:ABC-type glutathione transport system ATPase component
VRLPDDLRRQGFALMFVTHNLGLVPRIAQHVAVLAGAVKYRPPRKCSPGRWHQRPPRSLTS